MAAAAVGRSGAATGFVQMLVEVYLCILERGAAAAAAAGRNGGVTVS